MNLLPFFFFFFLIYVFSQNQRASELELYPLMMVAFDKLFKIHCTKQISYYLLLPYPSLAHSGADKEEVEPRGDGGAVRSRPSNSCT